MLDLALAPPAVRRLVEWLLAEGFLLKHEQRAGVSNQFVKFGRRALVVDVTADRGDWSVGIGLDTMSDTYHPDEWEAWLDRFELAGELSDLEHQVEFVTTRWVDAAMSAQRLSDAEQQIRAIGIDYVRRRFGEWSAEP